MEHIKGHQDRKTSYDSLDVVSQMNVDADALATLELKEYGSLLPTVPFDPICKVLFHINGRTITGDISTAIQHSLFAPKLQEYQCNRFCTMPKRQAVLNNSCCKIMIVSLECKNEKGRAGSEKPALQKYV